MSTEPILKIATVQRMIKHCLLLLLAASLVAATGCKQAPPTGDTSTLAGTLQLIEDILNQSPMVHFTTHVNDRSAEIVFAVTRAKGDAGKCGVGYHVRSTIAGMVLFDRDGKIAFRQTEGLNLITAEEYFKASAPTSDPKVTPPTYVLRVEQDGAGRQAGQGEAFIFADKAWAEALKTAMSRAIVLCKTNP